MAKNPIARFLDPDRGGSLTQRFRQQRNEELKRRFPDLAEMRVLDLGGTPIFWRVAGLRAQHVTIVNLDRPEDLPEPWMDVIQGDGCVGGFGKFDLVFSNSLLEHVGGHTRRQQFADVVHESAPAYWIQTPYRYFPIEPHWLFPGFQFLPFAARVAITKHRNFGHDTMVKDTARAVALVSSIELLSATEMRAYFPDGNIWYERIGGLTKSIVAYRTA